MKPPGNSRTIVSYGNAITPFIGSPVSIEHRVGVGAPGLLGPPGLTNAPRMSILEKITPPNINATKGILTAQARVRAVVTRHSNRAINVVRGYARALTTRQR